MFGRSVFAKEADALLAIRPVYSEPPPELKCPLCSNIFKDAVMIPCCQYSFCDKCKIHVYSFDYDIVLVHFQGDLRFSILGFDTCYRGCNGN